MRTKSNNEKKIDAAIHRHRRWIIAALIVIDVILLDFAPMIGGGNISTYAKWIECGQRPVREALSFAGGVRHYEDIPIFQITRFMTTSENMYCTPLDAENAGLSASNLQYQFPHLDAAKRQ